MGESTGLISDLGLPYGFSANKFPWIEGVSRRRENEYHITEVEQETIKKYYSFDSISGANFEMALDEYKDRLLRIIERHDLPVSWKPVKCPPGNFGTGNGIIPPDEKQEIIELFPGVWDWILFNIEEYKNGYMGLL